MNRKHCGLLFLLLLAQAAGAVEPTCSIRQPRLRVNRPDIFTEQQEQWLGDAQADMIEPRYILLPAAQSEYLNDIGQRLLDQLPPTSIHYSFRVFESPELRVFSLAGGRIYISRKLIMDARNEDELAAMLAQAIGKVYIHHTASAVTRRIKRLMHVNTLGDRENVYDTFQRMLNIPPDEYSVLSQSEQEVDELNADRVGMWAMIKAHYDPKAFATFLDRVNDNGGYTGNVFTDAFDLTPEISLRVRMAHKTISSLPGSCRDPRPTYRPGFKSFQQAIQQQRINPIIPPTPGLSSLLLQAPMNPALDNVAFSPDGHFVLAQDAYQIHVLSASPPKLRFSIDAFGAEMAQFTPDSQSLVFHYNDLHVERWRLATGQPEDIQDFVDYAGCVQTSLSPDGNVMACVSYFEDSVWLKLVDIHTGQMLYQNLHFFDEYGSLGNSNVRMTPTFQALMHWSRDGRYFVAASGTSSMAYDLVTHATIHLTGALSNLSQQRFAFVSSDKMLSTCDWNYKVGAANETFTMCYTTFPGGKALGKFQLPPGWLASVASGNRLLFGPTGSAAAALLDPATAKIVDEFRDENADLNDENIVSEDPVGGLGIGRLHGQLQLADLPVTPLAAVEASAFSRNGRYLALSDRARGAEWDLGTGKRISLTPPFRAVAIDDAGNLQAALISHELYPASDPDINRHTHKFVFGFSSLGDPLQFGTVRIRFKPLSPAQFINQDVEMESFDAQSESHLWSLQFLASVPKIVQADNDKIVLVMDRESATGLGEADRNHRMLIRTSDLPREFMNAKGTLVEVIANRSGKTERALLAPQLPSGQKEERSAGLFGSLLAVYGNNNNTTVYRISDGVRVVAFFGFALAGDDSLGLVAATNRLQELNLYDCTNGKLVAHFLLDQKVIAARFVPQRKQLLALTATQMIYTIDLARLAVPHH